MLATILPYVLIVALIGYILYSHFYGNNTKKSKKFSMSRAFEDLSEMQNSILSRLNEL